MPTATRPYRPSNGSEGMDFMDAFCCRCAKSDHDGAGCDISDRTMWLNVTDPDYPTEWIEDVARYPFTNPRCTAFEQKGTP